jgi:hypothetical protein
MSRRFRPTDAFVDESVRGQRYLLGCVLIEARSLAATRQAMDDLRHARRRIHFHNESAKRRREILGVLVELPLTAVVHVSRIGHGRREFEARATCLAALVRRLQSMGVARLVIESRDDDRDDVAVIQRERVPEPRLVFEHRVPLDEPMLWVADAVTWAAGAGSEWRELIAPILPGVDEVGP